MGHFGSSHDSIVQYATIQKENKRQVARYVDRQVYVCVCLCVGSESASQVVPQENKLEDSRRCLHRNGKWQAT